MEIKLNLSTTEHKELVSYCNLNDLLVSEVVKKSFTTGFNIERYGLLNSINNQQRPEVKEIIKEVIVEKIVEVPIETIKIEYVEVEKPIEKIVEVVKEVRVENQSQLQPKLDALQNTIFKLKQENVEKDKKIQEYEELISTLKKLQEEKKAVFLRGSNLNDRLYESL